MLIIPRRHNVAYEKTNFFSFKKLSRKCASSTGPKQKGAQSITPKAFKKSKKLWQYKEEANHGGHQSQMRK